jgi:O-antigen/teichoic acid export membrane protein
VAGPIALATVHTSAVLGLRLLVQAGTLLLVARLLGPDQFGSFAGVAALAMLLGTLSTFGTHLVLLGEMSKDPTRREQVLRYALPTTLACGSILLAAFILICTLALSGSGVPLGVLMAIGVAEMLLQPLFALLASELLALQRTALSQLLQILPLALRLVAATVVLMLEFPQPLAAYGYGYGIATAIALTAAMEYMPKPWPHPRTWRWPTKHERRESVGYALLNITAMGPAELDKTLAVRLLPLSAAGFYAAGARVVGATTLPVVALMLSALPRLFREGQSQAQRTARLLRWIFGTTTLYSVVLAIVLWWCAPLFASLFGSKYEGVDVAIRWLCIAVPGMALRMAAGSTLMALGKPWMRAGFEVVGLVVLAAAAIALTVYFGAHGMPLALACSEWAMAALGMGMILCLHRKK